MYYDFDLTEYTDAAMHDAVPAIAACGISPIVRIPDNQGYLVKRGSSSYAKSSIVADR
jgi:4-hydroxy-2-oxoheptanedioate aldolase